MNILRQVILDRANRKKDRSVSLTFVTSLEQSSDEYIEIDKLIQNHGVLYFKSDGQLTQNEIDELDKISLQYDGKTKSQKLRNAIYVLWVKRNDGSSKEQFYNNQMEKFITHIIEQIPDE